MGHSLHKALPIIILFVSCAVLVAGLSWWIGDDKTPEAAITTEIAEEELETPLTPEQLPTYDVAMTNNNNPVAVLETNKGTVEIELFEDTMPITAGNFKKLVNEGYYDGIKFHRVIEGFMIQGGDPITKTAEILKYGTGGPGYGIPDEHIAGEYLTNVRGTISMANNGQPNSGGSQFFINLVDNLGLDYDKQPLTSKHPVFGHVVKGMDVVDAIGQVDVNMNNLPLEDVVITKATIR